PQSRVRTYMVSVLVNNNNERNRVNQYFFENDLQHIHLPVENISPISNFLRLDYSNEQYRKEAISSTPIYTPSRKKIYENNIILATDEKAHDGIYARTVTT